MKKTAVIFVGQGSQKVGMLKGYYENFPIVRRTFTEAHEALGFDLWKIIQNDEKKLNQTEFTQPALVASSIAIWRIFKQITTINPVFMAGHSLGEYSALVAAKSLSFSDSLRLVFARGRCMQSIVSKKPSAMSAILGLSDQEVIACCKKASDQGVVEPANFNTYGQVVISGEKQAVEKANQYAKANGAKHTQLLSISVPSHCSLMCKAAEIFTQVLNKVDIKSPKIPVLHNFDTRIHITPKDIRSVLVKQLYSPVHWTQIIEKIAKNGISEIIECGPNNILTSLNKRIVKSINCIYTDHFINLKLQDKNEKFYEL